MATITFVGPNPENPDVQGTKVATIPDELFIQAITALCWRYEYVQNDEVGPGQFAVQKIVDYCASEVKAWANDQAEAAVAAAKANVINPVISDISQISIADG